MGLPVIRHQPGDGPAMTSDHNLFATLNAVQQTAESIFGLESAHCGEIRFQFHMV
jgi:hypothetical protein